MSMPIEVSIVCPGCGAEKSFLAWGSLNVTLDPERKQQLISGDLTRFVCPHCGHSGEVVYPLLYHDMAQHVMVWLVPSGNELPAEALPCAGMMSDYKLRLVTSRNELVEKILIFDAGLDDRLIECFKRVIQQPTVEGERLFSGVLWFAGMAQAEDGEDVIRFEHHTADNIQVVELPLESLYRVRDLIGDRLAPGEAPTGEWLKVDAAYADSVLDSEAD